MSHKRGYNEPYLAPTPKIAKPKSPPTKKEVDKIVKKDIQARERHDRAIREQSQFLDYRIIYSVSISCALFIAALITNAVTNHPLIVILLFFSAIIISGEALNIPLVKHFPISLALLAIPAMARTISNNQNVYITYLPAAITIISSVFCAALLLRNVELIARVKYFFGKIIVFMLGLIVFHEYIKLVPYNIFTLFAGLMLSCLAMMVIGELANIVSSEANTNPNIISREVLIAYLIVSFGSVSSALFIGGHFASRVITDGGKNYGVGIPYMMVIIFLILTLRYTYSRSVRILKNTRETIRALASAPEHGGLVPIGHGGRTADIAVAIAKEMRMHQSEIEALETAALLLNIGFAVIDKKQDGNSDSLSQASIVVANIIRKSDEDSRVASIIETHIIPFSGMIDGQPSVNRDMAATILKLASDYELYSRNKETFGLKAVTKILENMQANQYPLEMYDVFVNVMDEYRYKHLKDPIAYSFHMTEGIGNELVA